MNKTAESGQQNRELGFAMILQIAFNRYALVV